MKRRDLSYREALKILKRLEEKSESVKVGGKKEECIIARSVKGKMDLMVI